MKVAMLIAPRDFKDETLSSLQLLLGKKDIEAKLVSFTMKPCTGYHGAVVKPQAEARELEPGAYDALLVLDGPGVDSFKLYEHRPLLDLIKTFHDSNRVVVGIGNGIKALAKANVIKETKVAKTEEETGKLVTLYKGIKTEDPVVFDRNVLTVSGSENIQEFVELLAK